MKESPAGAAANLVVVSASIAAMYVVLTKPRIRRLAWRAARIWIGASVPAYLASQVRQAWRESNTPAPVVHRPM